MSEHMPSSETREDENDIQIGVETLRVIHSLKNIPSGWRLDRIELADVNGEESGFPLLLYKNTNSTIEMSVVPEFGGDDGTEFRGYLLFAEATPEMFDMLDMENLDENVTIDKNEDGNGLYWIDFNVLNDIGSICQYAVGLMNELSERATEATGE